MSDIDPGLLEAARKVIGNGDGHEVVRISAKLFPRLGVDVFCLQLLATHMDGAAPTIGPSLVKATRDLREDPEVAPMLNALKAALIWSEKNEPADFREKRRAFHAARFDLAIRIAENLGLSTEHLVRERGHIVQN